VAVFAMPGGAEWLVILGAVAILFVPGVGLVWLGYLLGRRGSSSSGTPTVTTDETKGAETDDD
jgi:hypothetical protein